MLYAVALALVISGAGAAVCGVCGGFKRVSVLGLVPASGLATLLVLCTWLVFLRTPPVLVGSCCAALAVAGLGLLWSRRAESGALERSASAARPGLLALAAAPVIELIILGSAFAGVQVPLSTHDGAFHVETMQAIREGAGWAGWYPPGWAAFTGSVLTLVPWLDTAAGAFDLALVLTLVLPFIVFGLAVAIWHDLSGAGLAALCSALTYLLGYFMHLWSGWPLAAGVLLLLGVWTVAVEYVRGPSVRLAGLGGLLVGAVVVTHGTELYSIAIVLVAVLVAHWRRLAWRRLPGDLLVMLAVALVCAAPYLPTLATFASGGGASSVGFDDGAAIESGARGGTVVGDLIAFSIEGVGLDLPVRVLLIGVGGLWSVRHGTGRSVLAVGGAFFCLALVFAFLNGSALVRQVYATTFPWGLTYRLLTVSSATGALLAGVGGTTLARGAGAWLAARPASGRKRRIGRLGRLLVAAWVVVTAWALIAFVSIPVPRVLSFDADDAAAMAWLRANAPVGAVVANDTFADAGIWAPYKSGRAVLVPRSPMDQASAEARLFVLSNIGRLEQVPQAAADACRFNVGFVYVGARRTAWQKSHLFPGIDELRRSPALEEVFSSGRAAVFRTRLNC